MAASTVLSALGLLVAFPVSAAATEPRKVLDINPVSSKSFDYALQPRYMAQLGEVAIYVSDDGIHGVELWRSAGTRNSTVLLADICPGSCASSPTDLTVVGDRLYFRAQDGAHGFELWQTDGTVAGTFLVKDLAPGPRALRSREEIFDQQSAGCCSIRLPKFPAVHAVICSKDERS